MNPGLRLSLAIATTAALILTASMPAGACSCVLLTLDAQVQAASAVFVGTVSSSADGTATLDVTRLFKGSVPRRATVEGDYPESSCGLPFVVGRTYVVFVTSQRTTLSTNLCSGTTDDLSVVDRLSTSAGSESPSPGVAAPSQPPAEAATSRAAQIALAASLATLIGAWRILAARNLGRRPTSAGGSQRPARSHR